MILWGRNVYPADDTEGLEAERLTRMTKQLEDAEDHAQKCWTRKCMYGLVESHRLNKERGGMPEVGEILLAVGQEKNRGEWKKGVMFSHKVHDIEQALQLVCPWKQEQLKLLSSLMRGGKKLTE